MRAILIALVLSAPTIAKSPPPLGITGRGLLVNVVDGDTIDVEVRYVIRVRFNDSWAPERNTVEGEKSEEDLELYAGGKPVIFHIPTNKARSFADLLTLNRVLGRVWRKGDNESLGEWQIKRGNASTTKDGELGK